MAQDSIHQVNMNLIDPSPYQHRRTFAQSKLNELANSIKRDGLIEPIVIRSLNGTGRYELIAGERRLRACQIANLPTILSRIVDVPDIQARRMCAAENLQREDLSAVEEVEAIVEMVDAELMEDEEYQRFGQTPKERVNFLLGKLHNENSNGNVNYFTNKFISSVDIIFSALPKSIEWQSFYINDFRPLVINLYPEVAQLAAENKLNKSQTKALNEIKAKNPVLFDEITIKTDDEGQAQVSIVNEHFQKEDVPLNDLSARELARMATRSDLARAVFADTRLIVTELEAFNVICADPPWSYDNAIKSWGPARLHYQDMTLEDICQFPQKIQLKIADNAVLFLWATNPFLQDAFKVIEAWGFEYKTNIAWVKTKLVKPGSGFYVRGRHELLMICTKGSFLPLDRHLSPPIGSVLEAPISEHSEKPQEAYEIIEKLYPGCRYIDLFSRNERDGWTSRGREFINEPATA